MNGLWKVEDGESYSVQEHWSSRIVLGIVLLTLVLDVEQQEQCWGKVLLFPGLLTVKSCCSVGHSQTKVYQLALLCSEVVTVLDRLVRSLIY